MNYYLGAHSSIADGFINAAKDVNKAGGNIVQIFLSSPKRRDVGSKTDLELEKFKKWLNNNNMKCVIHSSYLVNLSKDWNTTSWWIRSLILEIEYASKMGAYGVVVHCGKKLELSDKQGYNNMYTSILYVLNSTSDTNVELILETPAGQGSEMCYRLEDFAFFYRKFKNVDKKLSNRFKICIDTCHIFAAGYDIRTREGVKSYLESFEELIGLKYVSLIHLNDSKCGLGCRKDRHENIGKGMIGKKGLLAFFKYFKNKVPIVLETPYFNDSNIKGYQKEIRLLKKE